MEINYQGFKLDSTQYGIDIFKVVRGSDSYVTSITDIEVPNPPDSEEGWIKIGKRYIDNL